MRSQNDDIFTRLSTTVKIRDIQRHFAFEWNVEEDGDNEAFLLRHYVTKHGFVGRLPVLLTSPYEAQPAWVVGQRLPTGVYFPDEALLEHCQDGKLDERSLEEDERNLDSGSALGTRDVPITAVVTADSSLLKLFREPPPDFANTGAFVLDGHTWTGFVSVDDLMSPAARMCLLALVFELEKSATELCRLFPVEAFESLSEARKEKAREVFRMRFLGPGQNVTEEQLVRYVRQLNVRTGRDMEACVTSLFIDCTSYIDKVKMVCKCKLTIELSHGKLKSTFGRAERLRNLCAHPGLQSESLPFEFNELSGLVSDILDIGAILEESAATERRVRGIAPSESRSA